MAKVTVRYFAAARAAAGVSWETVEASTVGELREAVVKAHGADLSRVLPVCGVLVDGVASHDDLTVLPTDATVDLLPPFAGG